MNQSSTINTNLTLPTIVNNFYQKAKIQHLRCLGLDENLGFTKEALDLCKRQSTVPPPIVNKSKLCIFYLNACSMSKKLTNINNHAISANADKSSRCNLKCCLSFSIEPSCFRALTFFAMSILPCTVASATRCPRDRPTRSEPYPYRFAF